MDNICRFIPNNPPPDVIQITNYVYEAKRVENYKLKVSAVYMVYMVLEGKAVVQNGSMRKEVRHGDIFFVFPSVPYMIESDENFRYIYISFMGIRANMLLERLGIDSRNFLFQSFENLESIWREGIEAADEIIDLAGESVLLYTLSSIGKRILPSERATSTKGISDRFLTVKKYIDENFSDSSLSLGSLAVAFSYNKKYLSTVFKKHFKIGITEYLNIVRINHACILMDNNYTSVSDVAYLCGYTDPMYFSRIFKKHMKVSPKEYMNNKTIKKGSLSIINGEKI